MRVLLAGISTRAFADSAVAAGFDVTAVDAFGDIDYAPGVSTKQPPGRFTAGRAAHASRRFSVDAVAYTGPFENDPAAVGTLASGRLLLGNGPDVLVRVRDPREVWRTLTRHGFEAARVLTGRAASEPARGRWMVKPRHSGGGRQVYRWVRGARVSRTAYLQEYIPGHAGSMTFVCAGGAAVPLGLSRMIVGDACFGAFGYRYCGSILAGLDDHAWMGGRRLLDRSVRLADALAAEFRLVGVNGLDIIAGREIARALEVNPRWSASMELVEAAYGLSVFEAHARAARDGRLPAFNLRRARRDAGAHGKAVVFARQDVVVGNTEQWMRQDSSGFRMVRDVPREGQRIAAGRPVCTVFARARTGDACYRALQKAAASVYETLVPWTRRTR